MKIVTLQPSPPRLPPLPGMPHVPLLDDAQLAQFTRSLDERDCLTVAEMVNAQLCARGLRYCRAGSRLWCACEARVAADVVGLELDLSEIGAQIEEARLYANEYE